MPATFAVTDFDKDTFEAERYQSGTIVTITRTTRKGVRRQSCVWLTPDDVAKVHGALSTPGGHTVEVTDFDGDTFRVNAANAGPAVVVIERTTRKGKRKESAVWVTSAELPGLIEFLGGK